MDHATFATIMKIQSEEMAEYKKTRVKSKNEVEKTEVWKLFWQSAAIVETKKRSST